MQRNRAAPSEASLSLPLVRSLAKLLSASAPNVRWLWGLPLRDLVEAAVRSGGGKRRD